MSAVISEGSLLQVARPVHTGAADYRSLTSSTDAAHWDSVIDRLLRWWEDPHLSGEDEDFIPPSHISIDAAISLARTCSEQRMPPPLRVVPDGEGGLAFERTESAVFQSLRVDSDGAVELLTFKNSRLVQRDRL